MNIAWVLSDSTTFGPEIEIERLKRLGSFWGSWRTWRGCETDNVICNDLDKAGELIKRNFQAECNFYIPNSNYQILQRPVGVRLYEGAFTQEVDHREEIVAMHLAATTNDIVLLLGFNWAEPVKQTNKLAEHRANAYRYLVRQAIADNSHVQWVLVDHTDQIMKDLANLENLTTDSMDSVLALVSD